MGHKTDFCQIYSLSGTVTLPLRFERITQKRVVRLAPGFVRDSHILIFKQCSLTSSSFCREPSGHGLPSTSILHQRCQFSRSVKPGVSFQFLHIGQPRTPSAWSSLAGSHNIRSHTSRSLYLMQWPARPSLLSLILWVTFGSLPLSSSFLILSVSGTSFAFLSMQV